jgi:hypothetical protein
MDRHEHNTYEWIWKPYGMRFSKWIMMQIWEEHYHCRSSKEHTEAKTILSEYYRMDERYEANSDPPSSWVYSEYLGSVEDVEQTVAVRIIERLNGWS